MIKNMKQLHAFVREREHNRCQFCGIIFPDNECCAHHVTSRGSRKDLQFEPNNCVLVCNTPSAFNDGNGCHNMIHLGSFIIETNDKGMHKMRRRTEHK